jgi:hypothetical protein
MRLLYSNALCLYALQSDQRFLVAESLPLLLAAIDQEDFHFAANLYKAHTYTTLIHDVEFLDNLKSTHPELFI